MAEEQCNLLKNGGGMSKYSTLEVLTGDTWIDGKPIYRKVVPITIPSTGNSASSAHNISNLGSVVRLYGTTGYDNSGYVRNLTTNYYGDAQWDCNILLNSASNIGVLLQFGNNFRAAYAGNTLYAIIEYTKSS
jgi:hypothetical protein